MVQRVVHWLRPRLVPLAIAGASTGGLLCLMHVVPVAPTHRATTDDALTCDHGPRYRLDAGVLVISNCD